MIRIKATLVADTVDPLMEEEEAGEEVMASKETLITEVTTLILFLAHIVEDQIMKKKIVGIKRNMVKTKIFHSVIIVSNMATFRKIVLEKLFSKKTHKKKGIFMKKIYLLLAYLLIVKILMMFGILIADVVII